MIELLSAADGVGKRVIFDNANLKAYIAELADHLLANGVIVPPCKVGDKIYEALPKVNFIRSTTVVGFHLGKFPDLRGHKRKEYIVCYSDYSLTHIDIGKFGKTVFLTKEEAEAALAERSKA